MDKQLFVEMVYEELDEITNIDDQLNMRFKNFVDYVRIDGIKTGFFIGAFTTCLLFLAFYFITFK